MADKTELDAEGRPAGSAGGGAASPTPSGGAETPGATVAGGSELAPEIQAIVEAKLKETAAKYESDIAKLKSGYDKKLAAVEKAKADRRQAEIQQALQLKGVDPEAAVNVLAGHLAELTAAEQAQAGAAQVDEWRERVLTEMGLDPADEEVVELVRGLGPATSQDYGYSLLGEAGKLATARAKKAEAKAEELTKSLPELVAAEVKRALVEGGFSPDLAGPTGGSSGTNKWRDQPGPVLVAKALERERAQLKKK
jgi:hypothetical protein